MSRRHKLFFAGLTLALAAGVLWLARRVNAPAPVAVTAPSVAAASRLPAPPPAPATAAATLVTPAAQPQETAPARLLADIPAGPFRDSLLKLDEPARQRALQKLAKLGVPREDYASLRAGPGGSLLYMCEPPPSTAKGPAKAAALPGNAATASATPTVSAASVPISTPPVRHSKPGATNVLYLDFNGFTITGTYWNTYYGPTTYQALPFDTDGNPATFSDTEQATIIQIWERVSEDYAPFNVDVTTEEPAVFTSTTGRAVITSSTDANGVAMPSNTAGGVAWLDVFGESDYVSTYSPALIYYNNLGSRADYIGEATAHELGHNFGLSHQGQIDDPNTTAVDPKEYYTGHGSGDISWAPIMGASYDHNVTQWSKGEYYLANNTEDALAIISGKLGYRTDEAGGTIATTAITTVTGTAVSAAGILSSATDVDVFAVSTAAGTVSFAATTYKAASNTNGGDADIKLELLDASGTPLVTSNPASSPNASLTYIAASPATYYLRLTPVGTGTPQVVNPSGYTSYASIGQYTITGTIVPTPPAIVGTLTASIAAGQPFSYAVTATNSPATYAATGLPTGLAIDSATGLITGRPTAAGSFSVALTATNTLGPGNATLVLTVTNAAPVITAQTTGRQVAATGGSLTLSATAISANGTPSYQWKRNGFTLAGATASSLTLSPAAISDSGYYQLLATNTIGTTVSAVIFVRIAPNVSQIIGWGNNSTGQLTFPDGLTTVTDIAAGNAHVLALKTDGSVVGWGSNTNGQTTIPATLANVVAISTGQDFSVALKVDGTVSAWGRSSSAQGNQTSVPNNVSGVAAISAGAFHTLAVISDGTVRAWGLNSSSQTTVPAGLANVAAVAAGGFHSLALKSDGTVVAWGLNTSGQTTVPSGLTNVVAIAAGDNFSLALKSDGTVVAWGLGTSGQTTVPSGLANVTALAAGSAHALALRADGTVITWGLNTSGQTSAPTWLDHLAGVKGGTAYSLALRDASADTIPVFASSPQAQSVAYGANATFFVGVTGAQPLTYQWQVSADSGGSWHDLANGGVYSGVATTTLLVSGATLDLSGLQFRCVSTNSLSTATSGSATLTVTPANQTITFSKPGDTTYGSGALSLSASTTSGLSVAISIVSGPAAIISGGIVATGVGTVTLRASQSGNANYNAATSVDQSYAVTPATLIVNADNQTRAYGSANPTLTISYIGFVNSETAAVLTSTPVAATAANATTVIGSYPITLSGGAAANYTLTLVPSSITITPAPLTVTADNQTRAYGAANPTLTLSYSGFVNSQTATAITAPTPATVAVPASAVNTYPITLSGGSAANYTLTLVPGVLTVTPAAQTITFGTLSGKTYGAASFNLSATADSGLPVSFILGSGPATVSAGSVTLTGAGTVTVRALQTGNTNYAAATPVDRSFTVAPAGLTVTADAKSRAYGAANPTFTLSYSGWVNSETAAVLTAAPDATTTAIATSAVSSTYPITLTGGSAANYTLTLVAGTLTVTPAPLTVTAANQSRPYNTANPALTFGYSGFVNSEDASVLTTTPTIATDATLASPIGTYPITLSGGSAANYALTRVAGTLTVTPALQTITFDAPADQVYGTPLVLAATASSGLRVNYTVLSGPAVVSGSTLTFNGTGPVTVRASQSGDGTYGTAPDVDQSFTVAQAVLTITADPKSRVYGAANPAFTLSYSGFAPNETAAVLTAVPNAATFANPGSAASNYPIIVTGGSADNYTLNLVTGILTVTKAPLTAQADNQTRVYNTANPIFTITYTGFVNSDDATALTTVPTASTGATIASAVNTYAITVSSNGTAANYVITPASGTLTITKATATATLGSLNQTYSGTAKAATATTAPSGLGVTYTYDGNATAPTNAGSYAVIATINDANYAGTATGTLTIAKATAPITLGSLNQTYSGGAKSATVTTTPAGLNATYTYDGNATAPTNAGSYAVVATISETNYQGTASGTLVIAKATAPVVLGNLSATYDGTAKSATATTTPAGLTTTLTYNGSATVPTNAGDYTVAATVTDPNYQGTANGTLTIAQAANVITFDPLSGNSIGNQPFDVSANTSSGLPATFSVLSGPATLTNGHTVTITGSGTVTIRATQAGDANYLAAVPVDQSFTVGKANQQITFAAPADHTYGDAPFAVSATSDSTLPVTLVVVSGPATLANGTLTLTGAGAVTLRASQAGDASYTAATDLERTFTVAKAALTVTATDQSRVYGAANPSTFPLTCTGFVNGENSAALTTFPTASTGATATSVVNTYPITVTGGSAGNYVLTLVPGVLTVTKAALTAKADNQTRVYNTANPAFTLTYTGFVNGEDVTALTTLPAGSTTATLASAVNTYPITVSGGSAANYTLTPASGTLTITQAVATATLGSLSQAYTGTAKSATITTVPAGLTATYSYNGSAIAPTNAGDYAVVATISDLNYTGTATGTLTITKATATVTLGSLGQTYDGTAKAATVTTTPAGLTVTYTYNGSATAPTGAGDYAVIATLSEANYQGTASGTLTITKATATVTLGSLSATYDGTAKSATVTTTPAGLTATYTYNNNAIAPTNAGDYAVVATLSDANYQGTASGTLTIARAGNAITFNPPSGVITSNQPFDVTATASSGLAVTFSVLTGPATLTNGHTVTVTGAGNVTIRATQAGDANYLSAVAVDQNFVAGKATQQITFAALADRTYGTAPFAVSATSDSALPVTLVVVSGPATLANGTLTVTAIGPVTLRASQAGDANFTAAANVDRTFTVIRAPLTARADNQMRIFGSANPVFTITYTGFVNNDTAAVVTAPTAGTIATTSSAAGAYPITLTGGAAANYTLTLANGTLTVTPRDYSGTYFGTFASGGHWALRVRADRTATYLAYLPSRQSAIVLSFTIDPSGVFIVSGTEIKSLATATVRSLALTTPESPAPRTAAAATTFTLDGQIGVDGAITGQLTGLGEAFTGAVDAATGPAQSTAGYYTASALGTASGTTYAIVSPTGQAFVVTTGAAVDGASGIVNRDGQLTATTSNNATLALTLDASMQTVAVTVTPAGSSTPVTYAGLPDTVTPVARVVNLSVRSIAGINDQTLIVGLVITGSGDKTLLVRGIGPGIAQSVSNALTDPRLRLLDAQGTELEANDDWGGGSTLTTAFAALGASPLAPASKDAAIYRAIPAGLYSFHVFPADSVTGVALAELYDADVTQGTAQVVNISARTQVGTGDNILIAGFVITGNSPKTLLIRGQGPSLAGVTGVLADPQLYLFQGGTFVTSNDNWGGTDALKAAFATVGAGALASDTSKDAALLVTLGPGLYSAQVSGVGGTTGVGLVEIFLLP